MIADRKSCENEIVLLVRETSGTVGLTSVVMLLPFSSILSVNGFFFEKKPLCLVCGTAVAPNFLAVLGLESAIR